MNFTEIFSNSIKLVIDGFIIGIPNLILALLIFIFGYLIAKSISKIIALLLSKLGVDKLSDRLKDIDFVHRMKIDLKASVVFSKIIYFLLLLVFLTAATDVLNMPTLSNLVVNTISFIPQLLSAIAILILGVLGSELIRKLIHTTCESLGIPTAKIISSFVFYFLVITVFIMALGQARINTEFLSRNISIIIGGIVFAFALGYGLASKDVVSGILASMYSKDRIQIGDVIVYQQVRGIIVDIDRTTVTIKTDNGRVIVPLGKLMQDQIEILD